MQNTMTTPLPSIKTLSPEAVRVMIAEARGECVHKIWAFNGAGNYCTECKGLDYHSVHSPMATHVPNYPESLDAMHEAEKGLVENQWRAFEEALITVKYGSSWPIWHATALQRCYAFLIATGRATL